MTAQNTPEQDDARTPGGLPRRRLVAGAGAAAVSAAAGLVGASTATASPSSSPSDSLADSLAESLRDPAERDTPVTSTIASPPVTGWVYRYASMFDFTVEKGDIFRFWGGAGVYSASSLMHATFDIPAGARVREVEWYVYNTTGASVTAYARLWRAGTGTLGLGVASTTIGTNSAITAYRVFTSSDSYGPFPPGCKVDLLVSGEGSALQINGARLGFDHGGGEVGVLNPPVRAFDSRELGPKLTAGATRFITLPASVVQPGVAAVNLTITAVGANARGTLAVRPAGFAALTVGTLNYATSPTTNTVSVVVSTSRQIAVTPSTATHLVVDVAGVVG